MLVWIFDLHAISYIFQKYWWFLSHKKNLPIIFRSQIFFSNPDSKHSLWKFQPPQLESLSRSLKNFSSKLPTSDTKNFFLRIPFVDRTMQWNLSSASSPQFIDESIVFSSPFRLSTRCSNWLHSCQPQPAQIFIGTRSTFLFPLISTSFNAVI